jgi:DNA-binding phage protein
MTAQTVKKQGGRKISQGSSCIGKEQHTELAKQMKLFSIATKMKKSGLSESFIVNAVRTALEIDGVADLMSFWADEKDKNEKDEIIADIQDLIEACEQKDTREEMYIKFNDLDAIAKNIRAFKDSLYQEVMKRGGISKLAELTNIPQPSLSRFFNSNAMPRRSTVLAIAKALGLDGIEIDMKWSK